MNKKIFMKGAKRLILIPALFFVGIAAFSQEGNVDFTGNWTFNEEKSEPGEGRMEIEPYRLKVVHEEDNLIVERTAVDARGRTLELKGEYVLGGVTNVNTGMGGQEIRSAVTWSDDGEKLLFRTSRTVQPGGRAMQTREMRSDEAWSLSDDGKTLTIEITRHTQRGRMKRRIVYDREGAVS